jgi:hypothetical protein
MSMKTLYDVVPHLVTKSIAYRTYAVNPNVHFCVSEFVDVTENVPEPFWMASLADPHTREVSPNGNYGFSVSTFQRAITQYTE